MSCLAAILNFHGPSYEPKCDEQYSNGESAISGSEYKDIRVFNENFPRNYKRGSDAAYKLTDVK